MTTRSIRDLLDAHPFFAGLEEAHLDLVAGCGTNVAYPPGAAVFREGEPADTFYLVREGRIAIEIPVPQRGPVVIETLGPGEVVGFSWLFPPYRFRYDAVAVDGVRAVALDGACLRGKCDDDPRLGYALMQRFARLMVRRLEATRLQVLDVYGRERDD